VENQKNIRKGKQELDQEYSEPQEVRKKRLSSQSVAQDTRTVDDPPVSASGKKVVTEKTKVRETLNTVQRSEKEKSD